MDSKPIHTHISKLHQDLNIIILLVPAILFTLILAIYYFSYKNNTYGHKLTTEEVQVLGKEGV